MRALGKDREAALWLAIGLGVMLGTMVAILLYAGLR